MVSQACDCPLGGMPDPRSLGGFPGTRSLPMGWVGYTMATDASATHPTGMHSC